MSKNERKNSNLSVDASLLKSCVMPRKGDAIGHYHGNGNSLIMKE